MHHIVDKNHLIRIPSAGRVWKTFFQSTDKIMLTKKSRADRDFCQYHICEYQQAFCSWFQIIFLSHSIIGSTIRNYAIKIYRKALKFESYHIGFQIQTSHIQACSIIANTSFHYKIWSIVYLIYQTVCRIAYILYVCFCFHQF